MSLLTKFGISISYSLWDLCDTKRDRQMERRSGLYPLGCWCWSRLYIPHGVCNL